RNPSRQTSAISTAWYSRGGIRKDEPSVPCVLLSLSKTVRVVAGSCPAGTEQSPVTTYALFLSGRLLTNRLLLRWRLSLGFRFRLRVRRGFRRLLASRRRSCPYRRAITVFLRRHNFKMRNAPHVVIRAPHGRRTNPLHAWPIVRHRMLHVQIIESDIQALFCAQKVRIVDRRLQQLAYRRRHTLLGESQRVPRLFHAPSLDQVQHQPRLLRRDAHVSGFSSKFHRPVSSSLMPSAPT